MVFETSRLTRLVAYALTFVMVASVAAVPASAADTAASGPSFVVELQEDGDAVVTVTLTYDLQTDDERTAFRTLQNDADARTSAKQRFQDRLSSVAADSAAATGREMSVGQATIELKTRDGGSTGVVRLSVTWHGLAAIDDGRLVVTEPFASGFEPDGQFTIVSPDGYEVADAAPAPESSGGGSVTYTSGADLSGLEVSFTDSANDGSGSSGGDGSGSTNGTVPGFGVGTAVFALVAVVVFARRHR